MLLDLMVGTFDIPESRAKLYLLRFQQVLEAKGDALLAHAEAMDPRLTERALGAFLAQVRS